MIRMLQMPQLETIREGEARGEGGGVGRKIVRVRGQGELEQN